MRTLKVGSLYVLSRNSKEHLSWDEVGPESVGGCWPYESFVLIVKDNVKARNQRPAYLGLLLESNCRVYLYKKDYDYPLEELELHE
jgi:hypothetical protein